MRLTALSVFVCASVSVTLHGAAVARESLPACGPIDAVIAHEYSPSAIAQKLALLTPPAAPETLAALARLSVHSSADVRLAAVQTLARMGSAEAATRPLIAALTDVDPYVQCAAVEALGVLQIKASLPQLNAIAAMTRSEDLQRAIAAAIAAITGK